MRVLVVEDEPELLAAVAQSLREAGFAVDEALDGEQGLFCAQGSDYDAIVLDVMLPKRDGWDVLATLRRDKATPVLMLTARDTLADRVRGLDSGADDYLIKPFNLAELIARLRALIRRAAGHAHPVIALADVTIDTGCRRVTAHGAEVALTAREYALLEWLALHRGKLITKSQLYDHLFDEHDDSLSNLVEVHISNIRRKLGKELITTRRGQGYIIDG